MNCIYMYRHECLRWNGMHPSALYVYLKNVQNNEHFHIIKNAMQPKVNQLKLDHFLNSQDYNLDHLLHELTIFVINIFRQ